MTGLPLAIVKTGLVTPVGMSAPASCAAFRAKLTNPTETHFIDLDGERLIAHQVDMEQAWRGLTRLAKMAAMAIDEALEDVPRKEWERVPFYLCVAETERPGRTAKLDEKLLRMIEDELATRFAPDSRIFPYGKVGVAVALSHARNRLSFGNIPLVLVAAVDSLLTAPTLMHYESESRLLSGENSDGFIPGEGAGALLIRVADVQTNGLVCTGIGFGKENSSIDSEKPLRAEGLTNAIRAALVEAGCAMHDFDFRIADISGEQYYFKEAALSLSRTLRQRKEEFDLWHPAECMGEAGASLGAAIVALADASCRKGYSRGHCILAHMANDGGRRAALSLQFRTTQ